MGLDRHGAPASCTTCYDGQRKPDDGYTHETFALPPIEAREEAEKYYRDFPKNVYVTSLEKWHTLPDGRIEFTMRRLRTRLK